MGPVKMCATRRTVSKNELLRATGDDQGSSLSPVGAFRLTRLRYPGTWARDVLWKSTLILPAVFLFCHGVAASDRFAIPFTEFLQTHCLDCHEAATAEGGLDLSALPLEAADRDALRRWTLVHDRVRIGEMPPDDPLSDDQKRPFLRELSRKLMDVDRQMIERDGRSVLRRLNRFEYENTLRDMLSAPWLELANRLPEDGTIYGFNRSGEALDVAHVQVARYLEAADYALREVLTKSKHQPKSSTTRYYAGDQLRFVTPTATEPPTPMPC
jgi:Protein of unknown function (DUF1587)/Planctomycete cytochrome C